MLLAAGRGTRLQPLTDSCPKPLIEVGMRPLLQWHLEALARQTNIDRVCINTAWLEDDITDYFDARFQLADFLPEGQSADDIPASHNRAIALSYSKEGKAFGHALETAGGISYALSQLADTFWLAAGDALAPDFAFSRTDYEAFAQDEKALAQLWLVPNPAFKERGDFGIDADTQLATLEPTYTYSGIGLFKKTLFHAPYCPLPAGNPQGKTLRLADVLRPAIQANRVRASLYTDYWQDVGTPERLAAARAHMQTYRPAD